MWELRLILILIGLAFIAAVYLLSRQRNTRRSGFKRGEPSFDEAESLLPPSDSASSGPPMRFLPETPIEPATAGGDNGSAAKQMILALHVACRGQTGFAGAEVLAALQASGLRFGQYHLFHRLMKGEAEKSVFSVANMVEPGVLEPEDLPQARIPGLTLFLLLPGPQDGVAACADMLATTRSLARHLDGEVLDEHHAPLTLQAAQQIRERILEFQRRTSVQPPS